MSAERRAKVGDVIAHGETIPANVVRAKCSDQPWASTLVRVTEGAADGPRYWTAGRMETWDEVNVMIPAHMFPLTVVEVDPEPQPAEPAAVAVALDALIADAEAQDRRRAEPVVGRCYTSTGHLPHTWVYAPGTDVREVRSCDGAARTAAPGPGVLTLPEVPAGAVLAGASGHSYVLRGGVWDDMDGPWSGKLGAVLDREHPNGVTVELAPPREPRTWPKLDGAPADISEVVEVEGHGRFRIAVRRQLGDTTYVHEDEHGATGHVTFTLGRLRELGKVTEVLDA